MQAEIDYTKSAQQNADAYFERSKEARRKLEGAERAIKDLEKKVERLEKEKTVTKELKKKEEREWYEKFYWFFTSGGLLAIGGRSAQQNEEVVARYFDNEDLFFHANVFGASVIILKKGAGADGETKEEVAQFAASFSKAWEDGLAAVDVFSAKREQVSKQAKGYLGTGSFSIAGEREWFRNVKLELNAFKDSKFCVAPSSTCTKRGLKGAITLSPGKTKKSETAKALAKKLEYGDVDYVMQHLPPGGFSFKY